MLPVWFSVLTLCLGWSIAHLVLPIPSPHWVQDGQYPILDALGIVAMLAMLPGMACTLLAPLLLTFSVRAYLRSPAASTRWRGIAWLLVLSAPAVVVVLLFLRPWGSPLGLVDWMPD